MGLPSLSFVAGLLLLAYLSSFVLFAFIRVVTGVSIQRLGIGGFRRIAFTPKDGLKIEIRGLGLTLHRPTFTQPTWLSVALTELKVTVDLRVLGEKPRKIPLWTGWSNGYAEKDRNGANLSPESSTEEDTQDDCAEADNQRSWTWERLTKAKERIKRLHRKIKWIRLVDLVASTSTLAIVDVGSIQVAHFTMAVDTRRTTVDRTRLFQHRKTGTKSQRPAEWILTVRSILFTPEGKDSTEILDHCTLNVHGLLYQELDGLRDASIALKLGRLSLPYDDIKSSIDRAKRCRINHRRTLSTEPEISFKDLMEELDEPGSREESIVRTVSDSKEFAASILRGIQEIQFAVSFFGLTKEVQPLQADDPPMWLNISMKEVGMDLLRLDPRSPAHLMYFSRNDIAHQALIAAISISVGIDNGKHPERLLYVPMATTTVNTTLPSKTLQFSKEKNAAERNANILYSNLVVTSPSLDFDPKHLPLLTTLLHESKDRPKPPARHHKRHLLSRLLPKANIKISVHEPVIRVTLPPMELEKKDTDDFDLLIYAMSSISLDVESSHSADGELHYSLLSTLRVNSNQLYYQTASSEKHNLLLIDSLELKLQLSASPEVVVVLNGNLQTFSLYMVRPEISEGLRQIVAQLQRDRVRKRRPAYRPKQANFLRRWPAWLLHASFQGSDCNFEVAGVDPEVSKHARGFALHLESWTAEYIKNKGNDADARPQRRRAPSRTINRDDYLLRPSTPSSPRRKIGDSTDGRRLALHWHGLEGFVMESADTWEAEPFLSLPRMELAFRTSTDKQGPTFHINSYAKSLYLHYSLCRHFSIGVASLVLRNTLNRRPETSNGVPPPSTPTKSRLSVPSLDGDHDPATGQRPENVALDFKIPFLQIKAEMPSDQPLMLHIHGLEAGRHRWANPVLRARLVRLYTETPNIRKVWSRFVSIKTLRLDYREQKRRHGTSLIEEQSFDIVADAIRLAVPHQLVVHKIFDNLTNIVKTTQQLHHRFATGSNDYVLDKAPEGPKHVPKVSLRSQALLFEIEDGSFDWKLGVIYRLGLLEQKQRLAREEAFCLKVKRLQADEDRRGNSRRRARSAHQARGRSKHRKEKESMFRHRSEDRRSDQSSPEQARGKARNMRYDNEGLSGLSGTSRTTAEQAREKLDRLNAQTWRKRVDHGMTCQNRAMQDIRSIFWGLDEIPDDVEQKEVIMAVPQRPALMAVLISDVDIVIDKPSFPMQDYPRFLNRIGKGMPFDMQYSLLIPTHVQINMGEARVTLRDYPLPFLHVPAIRAGQYPRLPSLSMKTDFVIAEEYRDVQSSRTVRIIVVPPEKTKDGKDTGGFAVDVRRTVAPVKTYSDMSVEINSGYPTRITWGTSYQPAIQDMMQVIEGFTKQAIDPSERVGFWDKIRLTFHSRLNVAWKGDGDVHLILKGSRDPYSVTGQGAGFVMCWQNDVRWRICQDPDPRNFMIVNSGAYILAIPDLGHYARQDASADGHSSESSSSISSHRQNAVFMKTIMKLSGNVRWMSGLVFERNLDQGGRSFDFVPHYEIVLKHPQYAMPSKGEVYDAFRGFRSHHIHMSVAVSAPHDREWTVSNLEPSKNYNSVHLTPRFFTHFFSWWSMFSGVMSLPIRQGKLWPGVEKSSKKFGRHLATIKYSLLLSPLYMAHIYKHKDAEDYGSGVVSATGLKVRLDSFMLDLHQRREEFRTQVEAPEDQKNLDQNQTTGMRINQAQLDFITADVRAVSASISGTNKADLEDATEEMLASYQEDHVSADLAKFMIPDNDWGWVDMDDFVELGWILPADRNPETKILPLAFAPRFTYFRQTDHQDHISGDIHRSSPFGNEPSHHCVMSARNDPRRVQQGLIEERLRKVSEQVQQNQDAIAEQELHLVRDPADKAEGAERRLNQLRDHVAILQRKQALLQAMYESLLKKLKENGLHTSRDVEDEEDEFYEAREDYYDMSADAKGLDSVPLADYVSDFNNRFIVHNVHLKWSNSLRNIILRYIHQVSQRRGFVYYMSRRAVKFILDIVEEQNKSKQPPAASPTPGTNPTSPLTPHGDEELDIQNRVDELLQDGKKFVAANDPSPEGSKPSGTGTHLGDDIALEFTAQNTYHVRLIAPQIQLQSEKNTKAAVLVTAKGMQLKVIQIMDKDRVTDDVSGLVQRRFSATMDSLQIFVTNSKTFTTEDLHMYSGSTYGTPAGSSWPPWVPFEVMFEFNTNPYGFQRVVQRTSASMRYDKYNTLRLKYNDDVSGGDSGPVKSPETLESRIDHLWIDFPHVRALCNSSQYYAMYIIVLDLLLYSEPLEKTRSERLEKIMLTSDFSDLSGAPEMVISLQERIRQLEEIKMHFQVNEKYLDRQGWKDRISMEADLAVCEDELFFIMKAITTSQRKMDDRTQAKQSNGLLRWYISASEIVWHLLKENSESLAEFQLKNALYDRTDNNDGSNLNSMEIERIHGLNLLSCALYPEMIAPYIDNNRPFAEGRDTKMLRVHWLMLEAIAGIPVMDHFEVNLFPLKLQLEHEIGKKLFEYIFPGNRNDASPFLVKHMLPAQEEEDETQVDNPSQRSSDSQNLKSNLAKGGHDGAGSLALRLQPTLYLEPRGSNTSKTSSASHSARPNVHHLRLFRETNRSTTSTSKSLLSRPQTAASSNTLTLASRPSSIRSTSNISVASASSASHPSRRFTLHRATSMTSTAPTTSKKEKDKNGRSDDITQMMERASSFMTLAYVKIPSMVLCLSYKGRSQRNFEDVHDLVFRMPTLEYRNKTWSNLDLALQLKKDVIRALISHTGKIIGNKFSRKPIRQGQSRLRMMANSSTILSTSPDLSGTSESNSIMDDASDASGEQQPRRSFGSNRSAANSWDSSAASLSVGWYPGSSKSQSASALGIEVEGRSFAEDLGRVDQTEPERAAGKMGRHLTMTMGKARSLVGDEGGEGKDGGAEGSESEDG